MPESFVCYKRSILKHNFSNTGTFLYLFYGKVKRKPKLTQVYYNTDVILHTSHFKSSIL